MNMKNLFATAMIAGLVAGSVAKAEDKAAPAAPAVTAPAAATAEKSCKGDKGCKGDKAHKSKKKAVEATEEKK